MVHVESISKGLWGKLREHPIEKRIRRDHLRHTASGGILPERHRFQPNLLLVFSIVVSRFRILVVPTFVVRIVFSLVMPTVRCCVLPATIVRAGRTMTLAERRCDEEQKCDN
jgi:hypothetical protein